MTKETMQKLLAQVELELWHLGEADLRDIIDSLTSKFDKIRRDTNRKRK